MEKFRIVIDPNQYPGKTEAQIRQMVEDAEIVYLCGIDPIGEPAGTVQVMKIERTGEIPVAKYIPTLTH